jgi:hypothetical protein
MKALKSIMVAVLLGGLLLSALAACGGNPESTTPTQAAPTQAVQAVPTQAIAEEPTQAPEPTAAPADTPASGSTDGTGLDTSALASSSNLSSYRSKMSFTTTGTKDGQDVQESMEFVTEYTSNPVVEHIILSGTNVDSTVPEGIETYNTPDTTYMKMGDQWLSVPATEDNQIGASLVTPEDMLQTTCGWKKQADTEINGIPAQHYVTTKDDVASCAGLGLLVAASDLTDAGGDLYIAKDGNYIVQMDFFYEGANLDLNLGTGDESVQQGRLDIHIEMSDVNQPFTIQIPEEAVNAGAMPEDIPTPADATEVSNMMGMISFKSASTPAQVADYYRTEMPNNGWTQGSDNDMGDTIMLEYTKDNRTASVMITTDDSTNTTSVIISVAEQ